MKTTLLPPLNAETVRALGWSFPFGHLSDREIFAFAQAYARAALAQHPKDDQAALRGNAGAVREALAELVALKNLKDMMVSARSNPYYTTQATWYDELEYERRKPLAWDAARAALADTHHAQEARTQALPPHREVPNMKTTLLPSKLTDEQIHSILGEAYLALRNSPLLALAQHLCPDCVTPTKREGWQWVPKEPTKEMLAAASSASFWAETEKEIYHAMLAAAPTP